jgi:bleomycin hydrolase
MKHFAKSVYTLLAACILSYPIKAQNQSDSVNEKFVFTKKIELPATSVKDQASTGTCWSYATTSFIESELIRMTKDTFDLSEMYFVRKAYEAKAIQYVRLHGTANFGEGGQAHDVMNVIRTNGMISQTAYSGLANGQTKPDHAELESLLSAMVSAISKNPGGKLSPEWSNSISAILDIYLGKVPVTFGPDNLTTLEFAKKINPDDYVEITSYNHHPFYTEFALEVPDNWSGDRYYNVHLNELIEIMDFSLEHGYTVNWDGDVSDKGFSYKNGIAILPEVNIDNIAASERGKWDKLTEKERRQQFYLFEKPVPEKVVTQENRQAAFDNFSSTDDHLMHITGTVIDQNGKRYFRTKNSWAADSNKDGGYLTISEAYIRMNTIAIMVNKEGIPKEIRKKLGIRF